MTTQPTLIDLQVNGYQGMDFSDPALTETSLKKACREIYRAGTHGFFATIVSSPVEVYERNLPLIASVMESDEFNSCLLGIHLEGPFISAEDGARGAHPVQYIRKPDTHLLKKMIQWSRGGIKLLTIAAELEKSADLCRFAVDHNICVSLGHQMAADRDITRLADAGARFLTHLGNGIPAVINRHENPIWAGLAEDRLTAMIITDGHHITPAMIKVILRTKGPNKVIVTSDQTSVTGCRPGRYELFGEAAILDERGRVYCPATGYLAGSGCTLKQCYDFLESLNIVNAKDLTKVFWYNPMQMLEIYQKK